MTMRRLMMVGTLAFCTGTQAGAAPDVGRGEQLYTRCMACHALASDRVGPRHCGLFGRRAGSVPGFNYSPAMRNSRIVWNDKTLDRFLAKPLKMVPGSTMMMLTSAVGHSPDRFARFHAGQHGAVLYDAHAAPVMAA